ncbi:probable Protein ERP1 [Saccharomycodes ludwigii]|uniref:Probable Protein ERP1 n=1 Tax=Saccharomycodes ludwigii TaxID=36035 RepID=A0A376B5S4_9ASCO|nr:hypothetical protein SCDLUD_001515 [Saccharomycodes ludwigii]KAH3901742.1 hypothetical protein SCDLUD_001515 [Saccharomycodes ludwigii]SSD60023.1 probable Protein ERP1 [Saccharomycodes ludwigii]
MKLLLSQLTILLLVLVQQTSAFYLYVTGSDRKCFSKELSKDTLLSGAYSLQVYNSDSQTYRDVIGDEISLVIDVEEVFDDNHRVVHQTGSAVGDFTFVALDSGEHKICFQPQSGGWLAKTKSKLDIQFEIGSKLELDSKKKGTVANLHAKVNILNAKVSEIKREQALVRERESIFRDKSESVNARVAWWSIIQLIVLAVTCVWQLRHLRTFFVKQKIL